jgi:hypothetical protein
MGMTTMTVIAISIAVAIRHLKPGEPAIPRKVRCTPVDDIADVPPGRGEERPQFPPLVRAEKPPQDELDSADRSATRATQDDTTLRRYITFEKHRNRLEWHRMLRRLTLVAGTIALLVPGVVLVQIAGIPQDWAARIAAAVVVALTGGSVVEEVVQRRRSGSRPPT